MKIHLRANHANGVHTRFTVFINKANCGELTMRDEEASTFHMIVEQGCKETLGDKFVSSGKWTKDA